MQPHEFLKFTRKNNCGECGYVTCLAFAVSVTKGGEDPFMCPYIAKDQLDATFILQNRGRGGLTGLAEELARKDLTLVEYLRSKIAAINLRDIARSTGCVWNDSKPGQVLLTYLGQAVRLSADSIFINDEEPKDPRDQILLYNYISQGGGAEPGLDWIGMESMPNSISKIKTLKRYCEEPLAEHFIGRADHLIECGHQAGGRESRETGQNCDVALLFNVLPRIPVYLLFWDEEKDDGFHAKVKILFDRYVLNMLDLESLVFAAERLAEYLIDISKKRKSR